MTRRQSERQYQYQPRTPKVLQAPIIAALHLHEHLVCYDYLHINVHAGLTVLVLTSISSIEHCNSFAASCVASQSHEGATVEMSTLLAPSLDTLYSDLTAARAR